MGGKGHLAGRIPLRVGARVRLRWTDFHPGETARRRRFPTVGSVRSHLEADVVLDDDLLAEFQEVAELGVSRWKPEVLRRRRTTVFHKPEF